MSIRKQDGKNCPFCETENPALHLVATWNSSDEKWQTINMVLLCEWSHLYLRTLRFGKGSYFEDDQLLATFAETEEGRITLDTSLTAPERFCQLKAAEVAGQALKDILRFREND